MKSLILFIVQSVCEDVSLNEAIEEIATLKRGNESILIFSIKGIEMISYSYLKPQLSSFELMVVGGLYEAKRNGSSNTFFKYK